MEPASDPDSIYPNKNWFKIHIQMCGTAFTPIKRCPGTFPPISFFVSSSIVRTNQEEKFILPRSAVRPGAMDGEDRQIDDASLKHGLSESGNFSEHETSHATSSTSCAEASPLGQFCSPILTQQWHDGITNKFPPMEHAFGSASMSGKFSGGFKQISPGVFYGSPLGIPAKNPSHLLKLLNDVVDRVKRTELVTRSIVWLTFPKQDDAIKFVKSHENVFIFSYQDHFSGQRRFLVSTYEEFWQRYSVMESKFRHHYEVIQEGLPCHLYFDLEYSTKVNREHNGIHMVDLLISFIFEVILDTYGICCEHDWIVELDSSTEEKFSRHLVVHISDVAFKDNSHVGAFVNEVCSRISFARPKDPRLNQLYVAKDGNSVESSTELFLDRSVYSRNRCFRLAFSSKAGKQSVLLPTGRFKCKNLTKQQAFMESLICRMDINCKELLTFNLEAKSDREPVSYISQELGTCSYTTDMPNQYLSGRSPFPSLDRFVESVVSTGSIHGWIRSWYWFSDYDLMVYNIAGSRYCERIGRQHKSNHVMYVVDFRRSSYYQKCYDPECRGYRSPMRPIPHDVISCSANKFNMIQGNMEKETMNFDFNLRLAETNEKPFSSNKKTDSIKRDGVWWQEVIKKVDDVECSRKILDFTELDF